MPCGQLDRRRVGHRCAPCKKSHIKCDGGRPCSSCVTRGSECTTSKASSNFLFVPQGGPSRIPRTLIQDSWRYISTYFQAMGSLMQASVLRGAAVIALSHEDENVSRTLSIVGALYGCRNPQVLHINAKERRKVMNTWLRQRSLIELELKKPEVARFTPIFISAMLLAVVELMLCQEDGRFQTWLSRISMFLKAYSKSQPASAWTPFERDLVRFFKFLDILSAIARVENPVEPQVLPEPWPARPLMLEPAGRVVTGPSLESRILDGLLSSMWQWANLQPRVVAWISKIEAHKLLPQKEADVSKEFIDLKVQGLDIVCEVTSLQSRMIANLIQLSEGPQDGVSASVSPYYNWALTGLSHMFQHDAWQSLMCDLPVMSDEVLHQQALAVLGHVEEMIDKLGLDLALFLPFADFVGWEMVTAAEKQRMLKFLDTVQSRGFNVADEFKVYLLGNWQPNQPQASQKLLGKIKCL
ncbi:transcription factor thi1 [Colletotrichum truncatum]|uniref:Transcription factor thi1 n=1 Tax=Colletotrichum truncatum TaxID=5467 RepID=A0ACC3Z083_COLTU